MLQLLQTVRNATIKGCKTTIFLFLLILQLHYDKRQCAHYDNSRVGFSSI